MSLAQLRALFLDNLSLKSGLRGRRQTNRLTSQVAESLTPRVLLSAVNPLPLNTLNGTNGFRIDGVSASDRLGISVSDAGDINGDGFDDLIIGAEGAAPGGNTSAGSSYVVFGKSGGFTSAVSLAALDGSSGFRIDGVDALDASGRSVSSAGDVNGDGFDDLIVGAPGNGPSAASIVFGKATAFAPVLSLSALDGTNGFQITGNASGFSNAVSSAGDVNNDGYDDLLIGAYLAGGSGFSSAGSSYVMFGKSGGLAASVDVSSLDGTNGFRLDGFHTGDFSGESLSSAGDVNGDGFDDVIIGARSAWPNDVVGAGSSFVVFGKSGGFAAATDLSTLNGANGFQIDGVNAADSSGESVSSAGDINGDGFDDLIVGAPVQDPAGNFFAGTSYVVFGKSVGFTARLNLATIDGSNGFRLDGGNFDTSGGAVSGAGDVNGDGFDDLIIGSRFTSTAGKSYVVFGKATGFTPAISLPALNGTNGFVIGETVTSVSGAGDLNGDGFDDFIVGIDDADPGGSFNAGSSYVVFGGNFTGGVETKVGTSATETLTANRGAAARDVLIGGVGNDTLISDGGPDVLIGAEGDDILVIRDTNFSGTRRLLGGTGNNTLRLDGTGLTLDLTTIRDNRITDINEINLTGTGTNTLILNAREVLNLSNHSNTLVVWQDLDDVLTTGPGWAQTGFDIIGAGTFRVLTQGAATLKVQVQPQSPSVTNAVTSEDVQTSSGLVISRNAADGAEVTHFSITEITGGSLFQNNGTSQINNGDFITFAQANAGLRFTPFQNSIATGSFRVQSSLGNLESGLSGTPVLAEITVTPVADTPSVTNTSTFTNTQTVAGVVVNRNDADGAEVTHFRITGITGGTLFQNNGVSQINNGDFITFAQGNAGLKFTPTLNSNATGHFSVQASTSNSNPGLGGAIVSVDIVVNTMPGVPSVTNAATSEDVQSTSGLVITRNILDGAEITHFKITDIIGGALFQNDGVSQIHDGDFISSADANAGLKFTPAPDSSATGHFTVQSAISNNISGAGGETVTAEITVDAVADTPSVSNAVTNINSQTTSGLVISRNVSDGAEVTHVRITDITGGTLFQNNGTSPINNGDFITFTQANAGLKFTPDLDSTSTGHFTIQSSIGDTESGLGGIAVTADITLRPAAPVLTGPATATPNQRPIISWNASPGAVTYIVSVRRHGAGGEQVLLKAVSGTSYTPTTELGLGRFSIRVRAVSASGVSSPYSTDRIVRISTPVVFVGVTRFQSTPNPGLSWIPLNGAVKYDLWINNLTTGQSEVVRETNLTGTTWNSITPLAMGGYRAWIRGVDAADVPAAWSKAVDFFVLPTVPVTGALSDTFDTTPTFSWSPVEGAIGYDLYLRNLTTGKMVSSPKNIVGTSFTQPTNLAPGDYRWSVYAVSPGSYRSQAATTQDVEIGRLPEILSPSSDTTETTPLFSWTSVGGAATYNLYVTRVDVINRGIIDVSGIAGTSFTADPLPVGSYRAWVRAVSASGEISAWNLHYEFSISVETVEFSIVPEQLLQTQLTALEDVSSNSNNRRSHSMSVDKSSSAARAGEVNHEDVEDHDPAADRTTRIAVWSYEPPAIRSLDLSQMSIVSDVNSVDAMMADAKSVMSLLEI